MTILRRILPPSLAAAVLSVAAAASAQSTDPADWVHIPINVGFDSLYLDTSSVRPAEGGGQRVWLMGYMDAEYEWPRKDVRYDAMGYDRVYRCDTFEWVTLVHTAYLRRQLVLSMPNIFASHMNDGKENEKMVFDAVCAHLQARARTAGAASPPSRDR